MLFRNVCCAAALVFLGAGLWAEAQAPGPGYFQGGPGGRPLMRPPGPGMGQGGRPLGAPGPTTNIGIDDAPPGTPHADQVIAGMKPTFTSDFANFDHDMWSTTFSWGARNLSASGEQECYLDDGPFKTKGGVLDITLSESNDNPCNLPFVSGLLTTFHSFTQTYGYFEMRAKLPQGRGLWPAFWLVPTREGPLNNIELDVMEAFGGPTEREGGPNLIHVNIHWTTDGQRGARGGWKTVPGNIYDGVHAYGVNWQPDFITWYFDGVPIAQARTPANMNAPEYMLANLAIGGRWAGPPDPSAIPAHMEIESIRAWQ